MRQRMHSHIGCIALVAIVFGLETQTFLAKSHIFIPSGLGVGGSTGLGIIPKKYQFFYCFPKEYLTSIQICLEYLSICLVAGIPGTEGGVL